MIEEKHFYVVYKRRTLMNLQDGVIGRTYRVENVDLPLELERRMEALGILDGTQITVLNRKSHGALIIFVRGTRFAIGNGIAKHITVREDEA
jgi:ferrous iron transport protein A